VNDEQRAHSRPALVQDVALRAPPVVVVAFLGRSIRSIRGPLHNRLQCGQFLTALSPRRSATGLRRWFPHGQTRSECPYSSPIRWGASPSNRAKCHEVHDAGIGLDQKIQGSDLWEVVIGKAVARLSSADSVGVDLFMVSVRVMDAPGSSTPRRDAGQPRAVQARVRELSGGADPPATVPPRSGHLPGGPWRRRGGEGVRSPVGPLR
jgi:hypothetical protein